MATGSTNCSVKREDAAILENCGGANPNQAGCKIPTMVRMQAFLGHYSGWCMVQGQRAAAIFSALVLLQEWVTSVGAARSEGESRSKAVPEAEFRKWLSHSIITTNLRHCCFVLYSSYRNAHTNDVNFWYFPSSSNALSALGLSIPWWSMLPLWAVFDWWHRHLTCIDLSSMGGMTLWSRQLSDASGSIQAEVPPASASASTLLFISFLLGSLVDPCAIGSKWTYWVGCKSKIEIRKL